ncbi:extracellular solute-binding protein [Pseudomonas putida]|uniref:extracellular solute-binding protein n=1 Tax=Pseudomonas putida TaxID=303 RepID=UPI00300EE59B
MSDSHDTGISRRRFLGNAAIATAALAAPSFLTKAWADDELTILTWETYQEDPWIAEWSRETGIKVKAVRVGSADEMFTMLRSGAVQPDIVYFDSSSIQRYLPLGLIAPIDISKIPNAVNIASGLDYLKQNTVDGKLYGVPYNWGTQPLMYDASLVKGHDSWAALWNPQYAGKVCLFDDAITTLPMIALSLGIKNPFNLSDAEFDQCREALKKLRPQVATIARGFDDAVAVFASGDAQLGYCQNVSEVFNLQARGKDFKYSFPKEGTITWIDNAVLTPKGDRPAAYRFINDGLALMWQKRFIESSMNNGVLDSTKAHAAGLTTELTHKTNIADQDTPGFWEKLVFFQAPESLERRVDLWNDFKAGTL